MFRRSDIPADQLSVLDAIRVEADPRERALLSTAAVALADATESLAVALGALQASSRPSTDSAAAVVETVGAAVEASALYYAAATGNIH